MKDIQYEMNGRRYDLDWARVLAFGILILYHTGQFYVADWGWHIKSETTSETLKYFMWITNPWRMPLLFFISGAAMWFAAKKISALSLLRLRFMRLLPPLLLGMWVIVPPQLYFQIMQAEGISFSYLEFYRIYIDTETPLFPDHQSPIGLITWTHLWFIPYLLLYTSAFVVIKPLLDRLANGLARLTPSLHWLYIVPVVTLLPSAVFLEPYFPRTFAVLGDWYAHAIFFTVFIFGYVTAGNLKVVQTLVNSRWHCLAIASIGYPLFILAIKGQLPLEWFGPAANAVVILIKYTNAVAWILCVLAWSAAYLNRPSRVLSYMNEAILPWYVFHQTIIIVLAWYLSKTGMSIGIEASLVFLGTILGCAIGYELVRHFTVSRFLFGLKIRKGHASGTPGIDQQNPDDTPAARAYAHTEKPVE